MTHIVVTNISVVYEINAYLSDEDTIKFLPVKNSSKLNDRFLIFHVSEQTNDGTECIQRKTYV